MPPPPDPQVLHVVTTYSDMVNAVRARVAQFIELRWGGLEQYNRPDIDSFVASVVPVVAGGQMQTAALTDRYLAAIAQATLGEPVRPVGIPRDEITTEAVRGVPADEVYGRVGVTVWWALSRGLDIEDASQLGLTRALAMAATDLQLAKTFASRYVMTRDPRVTSFRRVTDGVCCELCDLASQQTYHTEDLMPIHNFCSCNVEPVYGSADPGELPGGTPEEDLGDEPVVHEHGEIGPVLVVAGQNFTGPDDF